MRRLISLFVFIFIWCVGSYFLPPLFIPSPLEVANSIFIMCKSGLLLKSLFFSFLRISVATLFSISISLAVGLLIVNSKKAEKIIKPITDLCRYIPVTAFYPLLIVINPSYISTSVDINLTIYELFKDDLDEVLTEKAKTYFSILKNENTDNFLVGYSN